MKTAYWIATGLICVFMTISGFRYMTGSPIMVEKFRHLGYPDYFRLMLGGAKWLGVLGLLLPRVPATLREWAYAGFAFDLVAAVVSHLCVGDAIAFSLAPSVGPVPLLVSHRFWRRLGVNSAR